MINRRLIANNSSSSIIIRMMGKQKQFLVLPIFILDIIHKKYLLLFSNFFYLKHRLKLDNAITGQISFNNDGDRLNPIYIFKNVQKYGKIVPVGYYGNKEVNISVENMYYISNIHSETCL
jgi:hypothetical protein